jgi:hypothetical protein
MTRRPLAERLVAFLALASSEGWGADNWGGAFCPRVSKLSVMGQQRCQRVPQVPLDVIGEHAQERKNRILHQALIPAIDGTSRSPTGFTRIAVVGCGYCIRG